MEPFDLMETLEILVNSVSDKSSELDKITVLDNIKPSSFEWVIHSAMDFISEYLD